MDGKKGGREGGREEGVSDCQIAGWMKRFDVKATAFFAFSPFFSARTHTHRHTHRSLPHSPYLILQEKVANDPNVKAAVFIYLPYFLGYSSTITPIPFILIHTFTPISLYFLLLSILQEKVANDPNVKAAVIISAKPDNFIAGADIKFIDSVDDFSTLKDGKPSSPPSFPPSFPLSVASTNCPDRR